MNTQKRKLIFISHSAKDDQEIASCFCDFFLNAYQGNVEIFASSNINCGSEWLKTLKEKLDSADVIVAILTEHGRKNDWVTFEVGYVAGHGGLPIPLLFDGKIEDVQKSIRLLYQVKDIDKPNDLENAIAAIGKAVDEHCKVNINELKASLSKIKVENSVADVSHSPAETQTTFEKHHTIPWYFKGFKNTTPTNKRSANILKKKSGK